MATEGFDPTVAAGRLGDLIDQIQVSLPYSVVLVAQVSGVNGNAERADRTTAYNDLIPGIVQQRADKGFRVATVDMRSIVVSLWRRVAYILWEY